MNAATEQKGLISARWLQENEPNVRAFVDAAARRVLDGAKDEYDFAVGMNSLRGMCPDGCCGGVQECDPAEIEPRDLHKDQYLAFLTARGMARF